MNPVLRNVILRSFRPNNLPGLMAWFRFGMGITSAAGSVSQWDDMSGGGRHLKQGTGAAQPALQSDGSILFDGSSDFLKCDAFTLNQPETVYLLMKQVTWTTSDRSFDGDATNSGSMINSGVSPQFIAHAGSNLAVNGNLAVDTYGVVAVVFNAAASLTQVNNTVPITGNANTNNMGGFTLGATGGGTSLANIRVKEVVLYNAAHDAETRAKVIRYLAGVGGLTM